MPGGFYLVLICFKVEIMDGLTELFGGSQGTSTTQPRVVFGTGTQSPSFINGFFPFNYN